MFDEAISRVMPAVVEKWEHEIIAGAECVKLHLRHDPPDKDFRVAGSSRKMVVIISDPAEGLTFTSNFDPLTGAVCEEADDGQEEN